MSQYTKSKIAMHTNSKKYIMSYKAETSVLRCMSLGWIPHGANHNIMTCVLSRQLMDGYETLIASLFENPKMSSTRRIVYILAKDE